MVKAQQILKMKLGFPENSETHINKNHYFQYFIGLPEYLDEEQPRPGKPQNQWILIYR